MRAADADRQFVAGRLREALNEGRLNLSEYDERLQETYAAKTYGDLDQILGDLPVIAAEHAQVATSAPASTGVSPVAAPTAPDPGGSLPNRRMAPWLVAVWSTWLIAVSVNVVIWLLVSVSSSHVIYFWPMWVAGPWGVVLLGVTFTGLASGEHYNQRAAAKWQRKQDRRQERWERRQGRWQ